VCACVYSCIYICVYTDGIEIKRFEVEDIVCFVATMLSAPQCSVPQEKEDFVS
jgi:hypothetical protein